MNERRDYRTNNRVYNNNPRYSTYNQYREEEDYEDRDGYQFEARDEEPVFRNPNFRPPSRYQRERNSRPQYGAHFD